MNIKSNISSKTILLFFTPVFGIIFLTALFFSFINNEETEISKKISKYGYIFVEETKRINIDKNNEVIVLKATQRKTKEEVTLILLKNKETDVKYASIINPL